MPRFQYSRTAAISAALLAAWMLPASAQDALPVAGSSAPPAAVQGQALEPAQEQAQEPAQGTPQDQKASDQKASDQKATKKPKKPYGGGTPVDVIINNKFWETPPEPKDFVRENRQPVDELKYQPTVGINPERPKTRSKDELKSLQSELDDAALHNSQAASGKSQATSGKKKADSLAAKKTTTAKTTTGTDKTN